MPNGYNGKILHVDLTQGSLTVEEPDEAFYRKYMGGVDRLTAFLSYYCSGFRSSKWWLRLFYQLLDICIVNAFVISKQCTHTSTKWRTQK